MTSDKARRLANGSRAMIKRSVKIGLSYGHHYMPVCTGLG